MMDRNSSVYDFEGKIIATSPKHLGKRRNAAAFHPSNPIIAIGCKTGIYTWNFHSDSVENISASKGTEIAGAPHGRTIWFSESDSNLWRLDLESGLTERIVRLAGDVSGSSGYAQPAAITDDNRYVLARLTQEHPLPQEEAERLRKEYVKMNEGNSPALSARKVEAAGHHHDHVFCVLDTYKKELWKHPGYAHALTWTKCAV